MSRAGTVVYISEKSCVCLLLRCFRVFWEISIAGVCQQTRVWSMDLWATITLLSCLDLLLFSWFSIRTSCLLKRDLPSRSARRRGGPRWARIVRLINKQLPKTHIIYRIWRLTLTAVPVRSKKMIWPLHVTKRVLVDFKAIPPSLWAHESVPIKNFTVCRFQNGKPGRVFHPDRIKAHSVHIQRAEEEKERPAVLTCRQQEHVCRISNQHLGCATVWCLWEERDKELNWFNIPVVKTDLLSWSLKFKTILIFLLKWVIWFTVLGVLRLLK